MTGYVAKTMKDGIRIQLEKKISDGMFIRNYPTLDGVFTPHIKVEGDLSEAQMELIDKLGLNCGRVWKGGYQISFKRTLTKDLKKSIVTMEALTPLAEILEKY